MYPSVVTPFGILLSKEFLIVWKRKVKASQVVGARDRIDSLMEF
jgi:hypothetical protein